MKALAVIGQGFVGGSLSQVFVERGATVFGYDIAGKYAPGVLPFRGLGEMVAVAEAEPEFSKIYFICVPTPMRCNGAANTDIVSGVIAELAEIAGRRTIVIKSTVPPGFTQDQASSCPGMDFVFNPEFLTEANALDDMRHQTRIVLGGEKDAINHVRDLYRTFFPEVSIFKTSHATTAEMVKYFTNIHLAVRVILSCELHQICEALTKAGYDVNYDRVMEFASYDKRLGNSHMCVPGKEGIPGARGHCFPKDLNALIQVARYEGVDPKIMEAAWQKNLEVVPPEHRDWEKMLGRAVSVS